MRERERKRETETERKSFNEMKGKIFESHFILPIHTIGIDYIMVIINNTDRCHDNNRYGNRTHK